MKDLDAIAAGSPEVAAAHEAHRQLDLAGSLVLLDSVREVPAASGADAGRRYDRSKTGKELLVPKGAFREAAPTNGQGQLPEGRSGGELSSATRSYKPCWTKSVNVARRRT